MTGIRLLAVVEVPQNERVICQAAGCGRSVYKRIHVIQNNGALTVLGSECFKKLFGGSLSTPSYGSSAGRLLTPEERQMLVENTARLIEKFEFEHQQALKENSARNYISPRVPESITSNSNNFPAPPPKLTSAHFFTDSSVEIQAKQELRAEMGINPELPGWKGLVEARVRKLRGE